MVSKEILTLFLATMVLSALVLEQADGHLIKLKKLAKLGLLAHAISGKKILFPLPLPLPIPVLKENVHHAPYPVHHHTHAAVGYGYDHGAQGWW